MMQWAPLIALAVLAGMRERKWQAYRKDVLRTAEEMQAIIAPAEPDSGKAAA